MGKIDGIKEIRIEELVPYERNARIHSESQIEMIADSIKEFGFLSPCLIDKDKNIIAGHGRVEAAKLLGMEAVPCIEIEGLTDEQRRAYVLADNKLTELGGWDFFVLDKEMSEINIDMSLFGFEEKEVSNIDIDDFFGESESKEKKPNTITCPYCGETIEL